MPKITPKNELDVRLRKKLQDMIHVPKRIEFAIIDDIGQDIEVNYYDYSKIKKNQAIVRPDWNKYEQRELVKLDKRMMPRFVDFWDVVEDNDPQWCFVTGLYIQPKFRGTLAIQPFKNGEWCFKDAYDRYLNYSVISDKLTSDSMMICVGVKLSRVTPKVPRTRCKNNIDDMMKTLLKDRYYYPDDFESINEKTNNIKFVRSFFLKPNGKPNPKWSYNDKNIV